MLIVSIAYGLLYAAVFTLLRFVSCSGAGFCWLFQPLLIVSAEYIRTVGAFGFHYGVIGYSQWKIPFLIRTASVGGVWALTAVMVFFSALCARCFLWKSLLHSVRALSVFLLAVALYCACSWFYSARCVAAVPDGARTITVCLIQNNASPWVNDIGESWKELRDLQALTDEALRARPDVELVVWPETAVVPSVVYHYRHDSDSERHALSENLVEYMACKKCDFVIGNNHFDGTYNYNSALFFQDGRNKLPPHPDVYSKQHLVPLTEYFPFERVMQFPLFRSLEPHFWKPGTESRVFTSHGVPFSVPICFEDTFPGIVRSMRLSGSSLIVTLTNDSWSQSRVCQRQHLAMAAFRSAENAVPSVRSSCSGETCVIDRFGAVQALAPAFQATFLTADVETAVSAPLTVYARTRDVVPVLAVVLTVAAVCFSAATGIKKQNRV